VSTFFVVVIFLSFFVLTFYSSQDFCNGEVLFCYDFITDVFINQ
jgi:hypothetical protein